MNKPEIVSIGVVWDSERPTLEHIMDVFSTVGTTLHLQDIFHSVVDQQWAVQTTHNLVGVVTYYGKHYSTFFFHTKLRLWIYFDDATVKEVGPRWEQVVEKCRKGRYQPLLLLYATPNGTPCSTENAPKTIVPYPNLSTGTTPVQSTLRRSVTPSPEKPNVGNTRRAITPNPDNHIFTQNRPSIPRSYNEYQNLAIIQDNLFNKLICHDVDMVDGPKSKEPDYISRKTVESVLNAQNAKKQQMQLHRSLSTGSTSANSGDGIVIPDHLNVPRRRDSGNWSGDRNSTSSSSSTTMENPYLYLVGKMQPRNGSLPSSPTRKGELSSGSSGRYDAGYDSYSLSSTDSLPLQQGLKHNLQLAQIPEYQPHVKAFGKPMMTQDDCGRLCMEADQLLDKSRQTEDANDLETALVLCNAAATKARAAMDAPYNNPHMMTFARMKHNTCIMRARSLHRRMLQDQGFGEKDSCIPDVRHTREGSNSSARHSRQNSRDKSNHSRQNSKEMLATTIPAVEKVCPTNKNIEIYATLPKKKSSVKKSPQPSNTIEDEEYMIYDRPSRESRSIFSRSKNRDDDRAKEKRSRSEDRSKITKEMSLVPDTLANAKDTLKRDKGKEDKDDKKSDKDSKPGKKQHKIRRKLLMGGLIRRKNRSMPDLTEGNTDENNKAIADIKPLSSVDDSGLGLKGMDKNLSGMSGYLSEGHLEYSGGGSTNPNLERSKLMRKSFHGSAGKMLTIAKVPPPPPIRTTSQLSGNKLDGEDCHDNIERPQYPLPQEMHNNNYYHQQNYNFNPEKKQSLDNIINTYDHEPQSLPFLPSYNENGLNKSYAQPQRVNEINHCFNNGMIYDSSNPIQNTVANSYHTVVTKADVHQERSPIKQDNVNVYPVSQTLNQNLSNAFNDDVDEVDCAAVRMSNLELPPYPSPPNSSIHSRQASEEFPPPPPPLDNPNQDEVKSLNANSDMQTSPPTGLLAQLQQKRQQILSSEINVKKNNNEEATRSSGETWLKELQAKQAALKLKKTGVTDLQKSQSSFNEVNLRMQIPYGNIKKNQTQIGGMINNKMTSLENDNLNLVKNLASKFEYAKAVPNTNEIQHSITTGRASPYTHQNELKPNSNGISNYNLPPAMDPLNTYVSDNYRRTSESSIDKQQIEEEMREVEMVNAAVNRQLGQNLLHGCSTDTLNSIEAKVDNILRTKKKSVSFCDQVILVATAEDQEDEAYIPNPILERVLKSTLNKSETTTQPLQGERPSLKRQDSIESQKSIISMTSQNSILMDNSIQPEYVKVHNGSSIYQHVSSSPVMTNNSDINKSIENSQHHIASQPSRSLNSTPYQQISNVNSNQNHNPSTIYQPPPAPLRHTNIASNPRQLHKITPENQSYQSHIPSQNNYPNNFQNNQFNQTHVNNQPMLAYPQNNQYSMQQNNVSKQIPNTYSSSSNNYQQKQNSMYFPVNRTQPNFQGTVTPNYNSANAYQTNSNSPYQHVPTSPHLVSSNDNFNQNYDVDRSSNMKYNSNQQSLVKNETYSTNPSTYNNNQQIPYNPYQRVPQLHPESQTNHISNNSPNQSSLYQRIPQLYNNEMQSVNSPYQKVPQINPDQNKSYPQYNQQQEGKHAQYSYHQASTGENFNGNVQNNSPYQSVPNVTSPYMPVPRQQKKSVSFEPGTKGGADSPIPKINGVPVGMNGINMNGHYNGNMNHANSNYIPNVNSVNNNINNSSNSTMGKSFCNLCRKKLVNPPAVYCVDCDFYMSRFKPRT